MVSFLTLCLALPGYAWEFRMNGSVTNSYIYVSQMGSSGLFGANNADGSGTFYYNGANAWLGPQAGNIVSGSDGATNSVSTSLYPTINVNQAISLGGVYRISNSMTDYYPGVGRAFTTGEWTQFWLGLDSPWGRVAYGKRPFAFGNGLQFDQGSRTQEHLAAVAFSGPFSIGFGFYPYRLAPRLDEVGERFFANTLDKSQIPAQDLFGFVNYEQGPVEFSVGGTFYSYHQGPEAARIPADRQNVAPLDVQGSEGFIALKYNNGRFFFNAEGDWTYRTARWQRSQTGNFQTLHRQGGLAVADPADGSGSIFRAQYTQAWRYMAEAGVLAGPAKVSLLWAFVPGPDRRHGVLIDRQPVYTDLYRPYDGTRQGIVNFSPDQSNSSVFRPYSMILVGNYGTGLGQTYYDLQDNAAAAPVTSAAVGRSGDGYLADAMALAARVDYAVAANLNIYGSFFYAKRASKSGYGWGFLSPTLYAAVAGMQTFPASLQNVSYRQTGTYAAPAPSIPDDNLGWEVNAGVDWNLLESWQLSVYGGYWKPGKWFNYACRDKSLAAWDYVPGVGAPTFGVRPDRTIDGIFQLSTTLSTNF